jgi:hypothetical protein
VRNGQAREVPFAFDENDFQRKGDYASGKLIRQVRKNAWKEA